MIGSGPRHGPPHRSRACSIRCTSGLFTNPSMSEKQYTATRRSPFTSEMR